MAFENAHIDLTKKSNLKLRCIYVIETIRGVKVGITVNLKDRLKTYYNKGVKVKELIYQSDYKYNLKEALDLEFSICGRNDEWFNSKRVLLNGLNKRFSDLINNHSKQLRYSL